MSIGEKISLVRTKCIENMNYCAQNTAMTFLPWRKNSKSIMLIYPKIIQQKNILVIIKLMSMVFGVTMIFLGPVVVALDTMLFTLLQGNHVRFPQVDGAFQLWSECKK